MGDERSSSKWQISKASAVFHVERPVDKQLESKLIEGSGALGCELTPEQAAKLLQFQSLLLDWNRKVNLTAITAPLEVVEKHLIDSLAAAELLVEPAEVIDLGAGGGFPAIPLAIVRPQSRFVLVDAVGKKVGFLKAAIASLGLGNCRAIHARAEGSPAKEQLPVVDVAICRAFMALPEWLRLAPAYVKPGGRVLAMLGPEAQRGTAGEGVSELSWKDYVLPFSGAKRGLAEFRRL